MLMTRPQTLEATEGFFSPWPHDDRSASACCARLVAAAKRLPQGIQLLAGSAGLAAPVCTMAAEDLAGLIPRERLAAALGAAELMQRIAGEVSRRDYLLDELTDELARIPAAAASGDEALGLLIELSKRGFEIGGLPADAVQARQVMLEISAAARISLEYLHANLARAGALLKRFGVRDETLNASALFHNYQNGFLELDVGKAAPAKAGELVERAAQLAERGVRVNVFRKGDFNQPAWKLSDEELASLARATGDSYGIPAEAFLRFVGALLAREEARLRSSPGISLVELLQSFQFDQARRESYSSAPHAGTGDPARWRDSALGRALDALGQTDWLAVSAGVKAAGDLDAALKNPELAAAARALAAQAEQCAVTLESGRGGSKSEQRVAELSPEHLLFDLYCVAVLQKRPLGDVLEASGAMLRMLESLGNAGLPSSLAALVSARLAGQSYTDLLGAEGLSIGNHPLAETLARLKLLSEKALFVVETPEGRVPIARCGLESFRKAVVRMSRGAAGSPERVLALLRDKIVPEVRRLPAAVIAPGEHDLARVVDLAAGGVPARYALRRPWKRINLDPLAYMGSGLEPGIRNCLGCPVNSLYGLVTKTALASGFEDIITYEATGCFEVYSGIWPYTGKKHPSLHGVFGGAPSELLGGLAARKARLKFAHKLDGEEGKAYRANLKRALHLGWGGDGATFDIGFGNLSGLFSRLQKLSQDDLDRELDQRALFVCYDNEGYQNTGNQYSAASSPGGNTTTNPQGEERPMGNDLRKKPIVEIMAGHGASLSARMNIHRQEHIIRVVNRALEDGISGSFLHFLQPCTTGWKFAADNLTYDLAHLSEEGGLFSPVTIEHGVPYLEVYPTPRNPGESFLKLQARFKHLLGGGAVDRKNVQKVMDYYASEWTRNLQLGGYEGEIPYAERLAYLQAEHRMPRIKSA